jgi:hypothetical protein
VRLRVCARVGSSAAAGVGAACATADCSVQSYCCKRSPCKRLSVQRGGATNLRAKLCERLQRSNRQNSTVPAQRGGATNLRAKL